ncbi:MAG: ATP-binding protein [Pseudomonadota bacterium]
MTLSFDRDRKDNDASRSMIARLIDRIGDQAPLLSTAIVVLLSLSVFADVPFALTLPAAALVFAVALLRNPTADRQPAPGSRSLTGTEIEQFRQSASLAALVEIVEALPDPAFLLDASGTVTAQNTPARDLAGGVETGRHISGILRAPELLQSVDRVSKSGEAVTVAYLDRLPENRWIEAHIAAVPNSGNRAAILLLLSDLTQERRMEQMRADFVANASHELRTPLSSVLGFIETLEGHAKHDIEARDRFLAIMREQANRMARLINDLMSLSRIEAASHIAPTERVNVGQILGHVRDSLSRLAEETGVTVDLTVPKDAELIIAGSADEVTQVFQNLIENAIRYGETGKRVDVIARQKTVQNSSSQVEVSVRDYGPGIAATHLPRLTERFYRVDVESSRKKGGTGLGLAIVKHIVNRHRGEMSVESTEGDGALFTVTFDAVGAAGAQRASEDEKTDISAV